jgi:hypothetical protein
LYKTPEKVGSCIETLHPSITTTQLGLSQCHPLHT